MMNITKHALVIGDPINHSRSPAIHNFWLKNLAIEAHYKTCAVKKNRLKKFICDKKIDPNFIGCNVTLPHKVAIFELLDSVDEIACQLGAVNTVYRCAQGLLCGTNTDADGLLEYLRYRQPEALDGAEKKNALIIGAGGAARAAIYALRMAGMQKIKILARNTVKAKNNLKQFCQRQSITITSQQENEKIKSIEIIDFSEYKKHLNNCDFLINCSPAGMQNQSPLTIDITALKPEAIVYDIVYNPLRTKLLQQADQLDIKNVDGLGMLLYQAAAAFEKFFNIKPKVDDELYQKIAATIV